MADLQSPINLIITGVGGQGNVLAARLLATSVLSQGFEATVGDVYGLTQRGGSVASHVRWTSDNWPLPPLVPKDSLDILIAFEPMEALRILTQFGSAKTKAVVNVTPIMPIGVQAGRFAYPDPDDLESNLNKCTADLRLVKATEVARKLGNIQVLNLVMLGALLGTGFIGNGSEMFQETIRSNVPEKFIELNLEAFREGMRLTRR
jgi:indolepyruvate ferredoxin oxidoreductase beta subunit